MEVFEKDNLKYGFAVSKKIWYAARFYIAFSLRIEKNSPLDKIIKLINQCPWGDYYYTGDEDMKSDYVELTEDYHDKKNEDMICDWVVCVEKTQHLSSSAALDNFEKIKRSLKAEDYDKYIPSVIHDLEPFCSFQKRNSLENYLQEEFLNIQSLRILPTDEEEAKMWFEDPNDKSVLKVKFQFYGLDFTLEKRLTPVKLLTSYSLRESFCISRVKNKNYNAPSKIIEFKKESFKEILESFFSRDWSFLEMSRFIKVLATKITYNGMEEVELCETIKIGSIIRAYRKKGYYHVGVYLEDHKVIHVRANSQTINESQQFFQVSTMQEFIDNSDSVEEIRFLIPKFTEEELRNRALEVTKLNYNCSLSGMICEHLAFKLAYNVEFSLQTNGILKKAFAVLDDKFGIAASTSSWKKKRDRNEYQFLNRKSTEISIIKDKDL